MSTNTLKSTDRKIVKCVCGEGVLVDLSIGAVECSHCIARSVAPPEKSSAEKKTEVTLNKDGTPRKKKGEGVKYVPTGKPRGRPKNPNKVEKVYVSSGFPQGWHFKKEYIHTDGTVYHRGKPITVNQPLA